MIKGFLRILIPAFVLSMPGVTGLVHAAPNTAVTGSVFCSPVGVASVSVKNSSGSLIAGPVTTASNGTFSLPVPTAALSSGLRIESRGGTFIDEATGHTTNAGLVGAYIPGGSLGVGSSVNLDPSSTIIYHMVTKHGKTLSDAETIFTAAFGYAPDTSVAPKNAPSSGDDVVERLAGLRAIAFSQLTKDLGLAPVRQFKLLAAIASDLADGVLDGMDDGVQVEIVPGVNMPEDIQNMFELALTGLLTNAAVNLTGLTPDQIGHLPFGKVALTDSYRVEYVPGMLPAAAAMTAFNIVITNLSDGSPATGLAVSLMPMMHMKDMGHSSPVGAVVEDSAHPGTYKCTVYYLMASEMDGTTMGYWDLKVLIGGMMGESATFFPRVGMTMGTTTVRATLKGQSDTINGMMGPEKRSYYIFRKGLTDQSLQGTWKEAGCNMGFAVNGNNFIEYNSVPPGGSKTFAGVIVNNPDMSAKSGILIIRITDVGTSASYGAAVGKYTTVRWKALTKNTVGQTNARDAGWNPIFYTTEAEARALTEASPELNRFCCDISNRMVTGTPVKYTFNFFIAAKESMMSFPAVSKGTVLHDASDTAWKVNPIAVSVSTNGTTWVKAADRGKGNWTVSGLSGLSSGSTGTVFVKVIINGEQKTIDGTSTGGANGYASFTVTP